MKRVSILAAVLFLALSISAFGQVIDPVGFCQSGTTAAACISSFPNGGANDTISVGGTGFVMVKNGSGTSNTPWYLLIALPGVNPGTAPTLTQTSGAPTFTQAGVTNAGDWYSSNTACGTVHHPKTCDLYEFAALKVPGVTDTNNSMNTTNLFGSIEAAALSPGSVPSFFDVFVYTFTPGFDSNVAYGFTVGGSGLPNGTFLATSGGSQPFSTPFTTAGLVNGPNNGGGGGGGGTVPEPISVTLLATAGLIAGSVYRKRTRIS